jgi:hypothetical protein
MDRRKIAKPLLSPATVVEGLNILKYGLMSSFSYGVEMPVNNFIFEN